MTSIQAVLKPSWEIHETQISQGVEGGSEPANPVTCTTRGSDWTRILTVHWNQG